MTDILAISTGGIGSLDSLRMRRLIEGFDASFTFYDVDREKSRRENSTRIRELIRSQKWALIYQEGSGIAGGLNLIRAARGWGQPYIVSAGDPVGGFFATTRGPVHGRMFGLYEKALYRYSAGYVGWTPYLVGAAVRMGARRAITVEGAVDLDVFTCAADAGKKERKQSYGLASDHIVCGVVGSLKWTKRQSYCYGLELIEMLKYLDRDDVSLLIVGDGDGRPLLESRIPEQWRGRVVFTGRVPETEVVHAMNAMDIGFITQTLDQLGSFRLTTKLPEYLACGLPVAMSPTPGFYDYAAPAGWALPPHHPASDAFHRSCAAWLSSLSREEIRKKAEKAPPIARARFDYQHLRLKFQTFLEETLRLTAGRPGQPQT